MDSITSISIEGFKSIQRLDRLGLSGINVLIGPNGSGKSNLVGFFQLLNHAMTEGMQAYVSKRGFADSKGLKRLFESGITSSIDPQHATLHQF